VNLDKKKWMIHWEKQHESFERLISDVDSLRRTQIVFRYIAKHDRIVEAGCGDGRFVFYFKSRGYDIVGIDYVRSVVAKCREIAKKKNYSLNTFKVADIRNLSSYRKTFDVYLSMGVLEHFRKDEQRIILDNAYLCLKEKGKIIITVPNLFSPWSVVRPVLRALGKNMHYQRNITKRKIKRLAEEAGFSTISVFNADVDISFRMAFRLHRRDYFGIPNALYYCRNQIERLAAFCERRLSALGYNTYYIGSRPN